IYLLANLAYLCVLPLRGAPDGATALERGIQFAAEDRVATAVAEVVLGHSGGVLMAIAVMISTFGCNNGLILAGARIYYAMAKDRMFFTIVMALFIEVQLLRYKPQYTWPGLLLVLLGIPVYWVWKKVTKR